MRKTFNLSCVCARDYVLLSQVCPARAVSISALCAGLDVEYMSAFFHYEFICGQDELLSSLKSDGFSACKEGNRLYIAKNPKARAAFKLLPGFIADVREEGGSTILDGSFNVKKSFYYVCWAAAAALLLPMFVTYDIASGVNFAVLFQQFIGLLIALYLPVIYIAAANAVRKAEVREVIAEMEKLTKKYKRDGKNRK